MNDRLRAAIDRLKAESANADAPPQMERALLGEFDRVRRRATRRTRMIVAGAVAASLAVFCVLEFRPHGTPSLPSAVSADLRESEQPFVTIPYVAPLAPYERAEIVRMELPVAALIAAGLPMRTADPRARAEADVVVGQDGRARAVRLISISTTGE
jgi:hypothetical protein